jgi:hypothetical protein
MNAGITKLFFLVGNEPGLHPGYYCQELDFVIVPFLFSRSEIALYRYHRSREILIHAKAAVFE